MPSRPQGIVILKTTIKMKLPSLLVLRNEKFLANVSLTIRELKVVLCTVDA